jgi:hypothetical protein
MRPHKGGVNHGIFVIHILRSTLVKCLDEEQYSIVSASIEALSSRKVLDVKQHILEKIEHRSPYVRSSGLRYVSQVFPAESFPLLVHALQDKQDKDYR